MAFKSEGETLVGNLYLPADCKPGAKVPGVVVTGSWMTVKEQMADRGFAALAFDFRNFGESGDKLRQYKSPEAKIADIKNAVSFLRLLPVVGSNRIAGLGICASSGYREYAVVAPWLHTAELVKMISGGNKSVHERVAAARATSEVGRYFKASI